MTQRTAQKHADLIYDVGMHQGEDTWLYLNKGFRVVAFEADPTLVENCKKKFAEQLASGQLTIIEGAIIDDTSKETITFYKNPVATIWGTINEDWAARNERMGWKSEKITVDVVDVAKVFEEHGIPHFIKIDIEGADMVCLYKLRDFNCKPDYLSIESSKISLDEINTEIKVLEELGYDSFKAVQQASVQQQDIPNPPLEGTHVIDFIPRDASGLFGLEAPGDWVDSKQILARYSKIMRSYKMFGNDSFMRTNPLARPIWKLMQKLAGRPIPGWYDTHARHKDAGSSPQQ